MSDIRFNRWLHQSGTGGVYQDSSGNIGIGTSTPTSALDIQNGTIKIGSQELNSSGVSTFTTVNATTFTGNLTGNVTGNVTGGITTSQITVGDSFLKSGAVGLGTTTTAGRNAGVGTAAGTLIYNETSGEVQVYKRNLGWKIIGHSGDTEFGGPLGLQATGGTINDYTSPDGNIYRSHTFTSTGTFEVTAVSPDPATYPDNVEYLVVGGGAGGGGGYYGGGGGAGGLRTNVPDVSDAGATPLTITDAYPVSVASYPVIVGSGGRGSNSTEYKGTDGGYSQFGPPTSGAFIYATGGGGGGSRQPSQHPGRPGGSGGGASQNTESSTQTGGSTVASPDGKSPTQQGHAGGASNPAQQYGAGGGGAGDVGEQGPAAGPNAGGAGVQVVIAGNAGDTNIGGLNPGPGQYHWFAGGGGGGTGSNPSPGGVGGGGRGQVNPGSTTGTEGQYATGGGGGGGTGYSPPATTSNANQLGLNGGSGIVVVRYQIGRLGGAAKATGGNITFYNNKTIHTFNQSGTFETPASFDESVEYVVVGGGGGGGSSGQGASYSDGAGGGGAGAYRTGTTPITGPQTLTVTVGAGGRASPIGDATSSDGKVGGNSVFGSITSPGGGGGANGGNNAANPGGSGGSGGGAANNPSTGGTASGSPYPGTIGATPSSGWGHPGKNTAANQKGGGGGGAGSGGPTHGRDGGAGIQIPATFRDPNAVVGGVGPTSAPEPNGYDTSGKYWVAGGGGAGAPYPSDGTNSGYGGAGPSSQPYAGAGHGGGVSPITPGYPGPGLNAIQNTGSGGGGGSGAFGSPTQTHGGNGGAGIVIIAYPT